MIIVAPDGTGDFCSIQAAVDALPESGGEILIRPGEYREKAVVHRDGVRLAGEDRERTVITWNGCAKDLYPDGTEKGTFLSATLMVTGSDVTVENLTIRNDAGDGRVAGQAVAVYAAGDRGVWRNCSLIAHQLTRSRQYFENCLIRGDVDFIFGSYRCWFENCTLFMNERGGWYTAANTNENQPRGFVFHRCRLTGECAPGAGYLGRPWRKYARTVFLECEMDEHVAPEGFSDWDGERVVTDRCGEWRTTGARADQRTRHPAQRRLTDREAEEILAAGPWG